MNEVKGVASVSVASFGHGSPTRHAHPVGLSVPPVRQLGSGDRIYVFLSDAYLKSPYCMYELLQIWKTSGDDPDRFLDRIRVFPMPNTKIFTIKDRLEYSIHWKQQRDELDLLVKQHYDAIGPTDLKNWKLIKQFADEVNEVLAQIVDTLMPDKFDEYIDQTIAELKEVDPAR